jgi:hypothetical protein
MGAARVNRNSRSSGWRISARSAPPMPH